MSNNEAKFLLNAYRPGGRDAQDPAFAEALEQAKSDPAVQAWFAREQAHATVVAAKLRQIEPPAGLRDAILAGAKATERREKTKPSFGWRGWLAVAAGLAVLVSATMRLWPKPDAASETLIAFAMDDVVHGHHGGHGTAEKNFQAQLGNASVHLGAGLPVDFATLKQTGCRTLSLAGRDVLEVCFVRNGAEFHCYIAPSRSPADAAAAQFVEKTKLSAAAWTRAGYQFVVVGDAGIEALKRLL